MATIGDEEEIAVAQKRMRRAYISAVVLLIGLQGAWLIAVSQSATREVNASDAAFHSEHQFEVPNILSFGKSMPVEFTCSSTIEEGNSSVEIWWILYDGSNNIVANWNGASGGTCGGFEMDLTPGKYRIQTSGESGANFDQELHLGIWSPISIEGHIAALLIAIILGGEGLWRANKKLKALTLPMSQHKIAQKDVWEKVNSDLESEDRVEADVNEIGFAGFINQPTKDEYSKVIPELEEFDYTDEIEAEEEVDEMGDLGEGTMRGLRGPVKKDERIKRVGDIYDLMDD